MPNSTVPYMRSMTPAVLDDTLVEVHTIDEYVHTDLRYMSLLKRPQGGHTLLALVGVQCHQFHRALDLAAFARTRGCMAVIGGPHVMTRDTSMLHGRGVSFAQSEAELVWSEILNDATGGQLQSVYGRDRAGSRRSKHRSSSRPAARILAGMSSRCWGCTQPAAVPSPRLSVPLQLLFGYQDCRPEHPQPEHRHDPGKPSRAKPKSEKGAARKQGDEIEQRMSGSCKCAARPLPVGESAFGASQHVFIAEFVHGVKCGFGNTLRAKQKNTM